MDTNALDGQETPRQRGASAKHQRVCPWWLGYLLVSPLRRLLEKPEHILGPYVRPGMTVLEVGSGMGFFTTAIAKMVGDEGRVVCVDLQARMLAGLMRRLRRAGLSSRVDARQCGAESLGISDHAGAVDLAVLIHVLHEMPDAARVWREIRGALSSDGRVLFIEPRGHVSAAQFEAQLESAHAAGLELNQRLTSVRGHGALLRRADGSPRTL